MKGFQLFVLLGIFFVSPCIADEISITSDLNTLYFGDVVSFTGNNSESGKVYLFITGPNLPNTGGNLIDPHLPVLNGIESSFTQIDVEEDNSWEFNWATANLDIDPGTYTVYAVSTPSSENSLIENEYAFESVVFYADTRDYPDMPDYTASEEILPEDLTDSVITGENIKIGADCRIAYFGDAITLSGINSVSDTVFLFITGPNLPANGGNLNAPLTPANSPYTWFSSTTINDDDMWEYKWNTANLDIDAGTYTIYAVATPSDKNNLLDGQYATVPITIRKPYLSATLSQDEITQGEMLEIQGIAAGSPSAGVSIWILGQNYYYSDYTAVNSDHTFKYEITEGMSSSMSDGDYFVIMQHPMYNDMFNLWPMNTNNGMYGASSYPVANSKMFKITGSGSLQSFPALNALLYDLNNPSIDDRYQRLKFVVGEPSPTLPTSDYLSSTVTTQNNEVTIQGFAGGNPSKGIAIWILGDDAVIYDVVTVNPDSSFIHTVPTNSLPNGDYTVIVQHPMYNNDFDVYPNTGNTLVLGTYPVAGSSLFNLYELNSVSHTLTTDALVSTLNNPNIDDIYNQAKFTVGSASLPFVEDDQLSVSIQPSTINPGENVRITGTAKNNPIPGVAIWIIGKNYVTHDIVSVKGDSTFEYELNTTATENLANGQYSIVVQHPMYNGQFDVKPRASTPYSSPYALVVGPYPIADSVLFRLDSPGSLQGSDAIKALVKALDNPTIDDQYKHVQFSVGEIVEPTIIPTTPIPITPVPTTPTPIPTLPPQYNVYVNVDRNYDVSNPNITITFAGGPGINFVTTLDCEVTQSNGNIFSGQIEDPQIGSQIALPGSTGTDRVEVKVQLVDGYNYTIFDEMVPFQVIDFPIITTLTPSSITAGSDEFTLELTGTNFVDGAKVLWGGQERETEFVSASKLIATILKVDLVSPGTYMVNVKNPDNIQSNEAHFFVLEKSEPRVITFTINDPLTRPLGEKFTIYGSVEAGEGATLERVELWGNGVNPSNQEEWEIIDTDTSIQGELEGTYSFEHSPETIGDYWYGIHVVDSNTWAHEGGGQDLANGKPIKVTVTQSTSEPAMNPDFSISPNDPMFGGQISFTPIVDIPDQVKSITWEWGDETSSDQWVSPNPLGFGPIIHQFELPRKYAITLTIIDNEGHQSSKTKQLDLSLIPGDILLDRSNAASLVPGEWTHAAMYYKDDLGNDKIVEAAGPVSIDGDLSDWAYEKKTYVRALRVKTTDKIREDAIKFAISKEGEPYQKFCDNPLKDVNGHEWYCSELVWAAYKYASNGQIDFDQHWPIPIDLGGITPSEIAVSPYVENIGYHLEERPEVWLIHVPNIIIGQCPIRLEVKDSFGNILNESVNQIPNSSYILEDINQDGELDNVILLPHYLTGMYVLNIHPLPNASPNDTYSIYVYNSTTYQMPNQTPSIIAENVEISTIPIEGYTIELPPYQPISDNQPPNSITNLNNISYQQNYSNWTWTDPIDSDFDHVEIYLNGLFQQNVTKGVQVFTATGLIPSTAYTIGTRTVGTTGLINETWVNHTAMTASDPGPSILPPEADFNVSITSGEVPLSVQFNDQSIGEGITNWLWSFGDGETSTQKNPLHIYTSPGIYTVSLQVTNAGGSNTSTRTNYINATQSLPLVPDFEGTPLVGNAPFEVVFTDTSIGVITSRLWNFGDGMTVWKNETNTVTHTYSFPGTYTISLTLGNEEGQETITKTEYIQVNPTGTAPVARFIAVPMIGYEQRAIRFSDRSTGTPLKWQWDFGDGSSSSEQNPSHAYTTSGRFVVTLTVFNSGGSSSYSSTVWMRPAKLSFPTYNSTSHIIVKPSILPNLGYSPISFFTMDKTFGSSPMTVQFKDMSFRSPSSWEWDFDDGETSTLQNPTHTYNMPGTYSVSLTVKNSIGESTTSRRVYVR